MISLQEAIRLVKKLAYSFGKEQVLLDDAVGRVICESIVADRDYPPFNRATMDGIAISMSDWKNGIRSFTVLETIFAGAASTKKLQPGECYKIMTGASVPVYADAVVRIEDIATEENRLTVTASEVTILQNIALKGQDIKDQTVIIDKPIICTGAVTTVLASLGYAKVGVEKLPTVTIITTGDEVVPVNEMVSEVQIRNSNVHLLKSLLQQWKINAITHEHSKDDAVALLKTVTKYRLGDVLILSGAVSAGDADFVPEVLLKAGAVKIFHKVAIRPGKPIWFGQFENGATVFALPGNPFSTLVTFKLFIKTFLQECFGLPPVKKLLLPMTEGRIKKTNLDEFFPVMINESPSSVAPLHFNTSGDITATLFADALALHPVDQIEIKQGDIVECIVL